ncbi:MAG TPA: hypothetical protein VFP99_06850 [Chthoniobacterales bacterium]|nr:hypothetical protein [Chthoniobacterales bacterium]
MTRHRDVWVGSVLALAALLLFYFSIKATQQHFDYTSRIASALLQGDVGLRQPAPSWLNEMVPADGRYYSVFPLGAVLSMLPVAVLQKIKLVHDFPGHALAALIAALSVWFLFRLSAIGTESLPRRVILSLAPIFGTWTWCNLGFGGAWQLALGLAVLGQVAALYFVLVEFRPLVAGAFFALAIGNRTELALCLPIFIYFLVRGIAPDSRDLKSLMQQCREKSRVFIYFLIVPVALGLLTAIYNYARFHSILDFGYSHIPNVLQEPWYQHGLFSLQAIPWNIHKMLFEGFRDAPNFPFITFYPFGCSIFLASPFLFLLFREGGPHKAAAWIAIGLLTFALWAHGNPGGWQFSYRYAMVLLPWMFLLLLGNGRAKLSVIELSLFVISVTINAIATYQFLWTDQIHP